MNKPKQECIVLIDGSNFYFKLKDLGLQKLLEFDFLNFIKFLSNDGNVVSTTYYVGKIVTDGTKKTQELFNSQRKLLSHLKKHDINYSLGYLIKSNGRYHEKGVDVNIAVDILVATYEKQCNKIILISSDTDLLPAVSKAKMKGLVVEYVGFSHKPSVAMVANCSSSKLLARHELGKFLNAKGK